MLRIFKLLAAFALALAVAWAGLRVAQRREPGEQPGGEILVTTGQALTPYGVLRRIEGARAKDLALSPSGSLVAVLCTGRVAIFTREGEPVAEVSVRTGAVGVAWASETEVLASGDRGNVHRIALKDGKWALLGTFELDTVGPQSPQSGNPQVNGLALRSGGTALYAALGRRNALAWRGSDGEGEPFDSPAKGGSIPTEIAPYRLETAAGLLVACNRGGPPPKSGEAGADSAGTRVAIDSRTDAAARGSITVFGIADRNVRHVAVGRQPSGAAFSPDGSKLGIACSDDDSVVLLRLPDLGKLGSKNLRPGIEPRFGFMPTDLVFGEDGKTLFVTCGGINAVAVLDVSRQPYRTVGYIPTGWFPVAIERSGDVLIVASSKGVGSRPAGKAGRFGVHDNVGSVQFIRIPEALRDLQKLSAQVARNNRWGTEVRARPNQPPRPVPERMGEPSVFRHVVYIIKENLTYDSVLGDMKEGKGDPSLCMFPEEVSPNHHALARQFVLLDNTHTSGTNSADGHQWTSSAVANAYIEQNYGAHIRSYPYDGGDPLAFSPEGFLWNAAISKKIGVRVYGEFVDKPSVKDPATGKTPTWKQLWDDYKAGGRKYEIKAETSQAALRSVLHPRFIGFPSIVSDQWRADQFLADLAVWESGGRAPSAAVPPGGEPVGGGFSEMPQLCILLLPNDHTAGTNPGMPTPRAAVADNDLALGRIVEAISKSRFWKQTLILVIQDDSQLGLDHVDGHRTAAFVISPYTKRGAVVSEMYNHTSFVRTMGLVLGFPALTRFDRTATPLSACFTDKPDFRPYTALPNRVPLDELNPPRERLSGEAKRLAEACAKLNWSDVDLADATTVARAVWSVQKPGKPFPWGHFRPNRDDD